MKNVINAVALVIIFFALLPITAPLAPYTREIATYMLCAMGFMIACVLLKLDAEKVNRRWRAFQGARKYPHRKEYARNLREQEMKSTAVHEAGHAVVARYLPHCLPVIQATAVQNVKAGYNGMVDLLDKRSRWSREMLLAHIAMLLGGKAAEEIVLHECGCGVYADLQSANETARNIVTKYGMSGALGLVAYNLATDKIPEKAMERIHAEVEKILLEQYEVAKRVILEHRDRLDQFAGTLLAKGTLDEGEINDLLPLPRK